MAGLSHLRDDELQRAIDGELDGPRQDTAEAHLAECAECRERRDRLTAVAGLFRVRAEPAGGDAEWMMRARARLRDELKETTVPSRLPLGLVRVTAKATFRSAAAVAAIVLAVLFLRGVPPFESRVPPAVAPATGTTMLPVAALTPGAAWDVTVEELCASGGREQRPVSDAVRASVIHSYGMDGVPPTEYELDYLITPDLGGAPDAKNLWPQRYGSRTWNAHVKDQLERLLPKLVCARAVSLEAAQRDIATNWIAAYKKYFKTDAPLHAHGAEPVVPDPSGDEPLLYPVWRRGGAPSLRLISFSRGQVLN